MNPLHKIAAGFLVFVTITSCNKYQKLDFNVDKPESVAVQEDIDAYPALKSYINRASQPGFKWGVALGLQEYLDKGVKYRLVNRNFDEIVLGYEMKHGAVVQSDGSLDLAKVKSLLQTAGQAGMQVYGHTLMWHANQNASYLKGLIAPLLVTSPAYPNSLNATGLRDNSFANWTKLNAGNGISVITGTGMGTGNNAVELKASGAATDLQLVTPEIPINKAHKYEVVMYIRSNEAGEGRISFEGLTNNSPLVDWTKSGTPTATFTTGISWKEIRFTINDFAADNIKLHFDLKNKAGVSYYIDINNLYVYDTQGAPVINNLVANGDFESGGGWGGWGGGSTRGVTADGMGVGNKGKAFYVTNPAKSANYWDVQTSYDFAAPLENGATYELSFWVKGTAAGVIRPELQSANYSSNGYGQVQVTQDWQLVTVSTTATASDRTRLVFSYGEFAGTVYIDDVVLKNAKATGGSTTVVEKTAAEKKYILTEALDKWMSGMVGAGKSVVKAWDVVNEPMDDGKPYELKTGVGKTNMASDEFYWQDYLGKDYAVTAFKMARQYGNATDIHFINDYNLEFNLDKCRGLIAYVNYIESQGAKVDGIGTQMHIDINASKENIAAMFKLLAATGKVIKVSELDMGVGVKTTAATAEHYQAQADMYKYVIDKYFELIPAKQRYGITIWSPVDSPAGSGWRPGEPVGLWTEGYVRKLAYAAIAKALEANAK
ncbi:1,4-beta-xylanase [Chitinophaga polysaccharea]|uniref:endo-1,4-beta-xylanase n=1 Tax=Chitinophaga TaxID=79328 RepID=UPI001455AA00|nr:MULTISPECIES: endo-1,4-beta-xylanase [Chitinophaga]NLR57439.1 1,4-beta-xylanase [Chitinophaga polysaccharea]NLU95353.1 1,4-beta-xylanase [Chitinophaga sp. Ak27]